MKILLSGSFSQDQIMNFDGLFEELIQPDKLHVISISPLIKSLHRTRGGIAANIAYSLALLGEKPILYVSAGKDTKNYIASLSEMGIDTSNVHYSELPTATFSVLTDQNDCQVGGFYPGAMSDAKSLSIGNFANEDIFVVVSAHDPAQMIVQIKECLKLKKRMLFDIGQQISSLSKDDLLTGLQAAELLILNDYEMTILAKKVELTEKEIIRYVDTCVVTLGSNGSVIYSKKSGEGNQNNDKSHFSQKVAATKVKKTVDPTGAGDAFRAGFLYGYIRDWNLETCAKLGSVVAAFAVEKHGTQEHTFSLTEINKRYSENYQEEFKI
ncbi:carbohydrate kinase family protein [Patescibacteria group bacterium]|nr:carbohydrate kinase family protein [Patescibacteria group bacterium]